MGSGHFLVYAFDVLMQIYQSSGWDQREAAQSILKHNLYGLDIDDRAAQLAYFAIMMKARQYDRRIFAREIQPHVYAIQDSNGITTAPMHDMGLKLSQYEYASAVKQALRLAEEFHDAKEYGSILNITPCDWDLLRRFAVARTEDEGGQLVLGIHGEQIAAPRLQELINIGEVMTQKYDVVMTNPPYLGSSRFSPKLDKYVKDNFTDEKADLSMAMLKKAMSSYAKKNGFITFITTSSWMFLSSFEKMRNYMLSNLSISSIVDFGTELFDGKVGHNPIVAWVNRNCHINSKITSIRLVDYCYSRRDEKESEYFNHKNRYESAQGNFSKIPGSPIAYWISETFIKTFENGVLLGTIADSKQGLATGENNRFIREWYEIEKNAINFHVGSIEEAASSGYKWFPYNKGGEFRKWYGNNDYVVNWENDGFEIRNFKDEKGKIRSRPQNTQFYFRECFSWSLVSSSVAAFRYKPCGNVFDIAGMSCFSKTNLLYLLALCNSNFSMEVLKVIAPTINYQCGDIANIPVIYCDEKKPQIEKKAQQNIDISRTDWDSYELSWDFTQHPLVLLKEGSGYGTDMSKWNYTVKSAYEAWKSTCVDRFNQLKANEEELNRIFIDIYGLRDELTPEVEDKDVTVRKADLGRDIRSLISYAVGCMFGRYSLDVEGLAYAGGEWDDSKYSTFAPDRDNIIPICDDEYFDDDITGRFVKWVETVYGKDTLEENLRFIADALGGKGSPREVIRSYFLNDFYADHLKVYQKRPIYWLFDSGKKNGFKALIYMHRYQHDLLARMRTDYVHEQQERYRTQLAQIGDALTHASGYEAVKLSKQQKKIQEQSLEIQKYEEKIHHLADQNIEIDLDDGVKHNYALFEDVLAKIK